MTRCSECGLIKLPLIKIQLITRDINDGMWGAYCIECVTDKKVFDSIFENMRVVTR